MKEFKKDIKFNKAERVALVTLLVMICLSYLYNFLYKPHIKLSEQKVSLEDIITKDAQVESKATYQRKLTKARNFKNRQYPKKPKTKYPQPIYKTFNPNTIDSLEWLQLGVRPWTIKSILKYRSKGGQFRKCEDLNSIYNLADSVKQKLIPYCHIPPQANKPKYPPKPKYEKPKYEPKPKFEKPTYPVDINSADSLQLQSLYGIGPAFARSIIKYRSFIGGYHSIEQLTETYGIEEEVLIKNADRLVLTTPHKLININGPKDSIKHFFIDYKMAQVIYNYRKAHGDYQDPADIKKTRIISDSLYNKIAPYLSLK